LCQRATGYCRPGRGPHVEKVTLRSISNGLNYCAILQYTHNLQIIQAGGPRVGYPCLKTAFLKPGAAERRQKLQETKMRNSGSFIGGSRFVCTN
jgi:hypothetical protein